jgi:putative tricarboxylic transport membrane protein
LPERALPGRAAPTPYPFPEKEIAMSDRIFGIFGVLLSIGFALAALAIEESFLSDAVGPKAFPLIIAAILGLSSLVIALRPDAEPHWPALGRLVEIGAAVVVMILYAQLLPVAGFVIATALAASYLSWRLGSSVLASVLTGVGTSLGIYSVFHLVLGLSLARGPLGF